MTINKMNLKKIFLILYIFTLLYAPPIIKNVNTLLIVFLITGLLLITKYRKELVLFLKNKNLLKLFGLFSIYFGWYILSIVINAIFYKEFYFYNIFIHFYSMGLVIIVSLICILFLLVYAEKNNIKFDALIKYTMIAGTIQGVICLAAFLIPEVKNILVKIMYYLTNDQVLIDEYHVSRRFYGYSNSMLDGFGFGSGILACLPLFYSQNHNKKNLLYLPLLVLIVVLNSRTGIVVFGIGALIWLVNLLYSKKIKEYKNILLLCLVCVFLLVISIVIMKPITMKWIINDFLSFFNGKNFGTANILFGKGFWKLPNGFRSIIGCGYSIAGFGGLTNILGICSDVGYVNEIWRNGFIGLFIILSILIYFYYLLYFKIKTKYKLLFLFFLLALLVGNIKLVIFAYTPGIIIILMFTLHELLLKKETDKNRDKFSKSQNKKISVIVPVYNVEKYLEQCLNSLINQSYKNLEIILINDGSTDNSLEICKKYAAKDSRIVIIDKKNQGQAIARNNALDIASGDYIGFVDSDDWIDLDTYDYLYSLIEKYNADCSYIKMRRGNYDYQEDEYEEIIYSNDDILIEYLSYGMKTGEYGVWAYLYDKKLLEKVRFPEGRINEDIPFIYKALENANTLVKSNKYCYNYRLSPNSTTRHLFKKRDLDLITACEDLEKFTEHKNKKIKKLVQQKKYRTDFSLLAKIAYYGADNEDEFKSQIAQMKKNIRKNYFDLLISNMSFIRKIQLTCFVINYDFSRKVVNIIKK